MDRNSYGIKFVNGTQEANSKTVNYKYEESIENAGFTPTRPSDVKEGFVFAGWYENKLCVGDPFVFTGKTMPAQSITLYAKWQAPIIEAKVYLTASADGEFEKIEIQYGTKLSDSEVFKALLEKLTEKPSSLDRFQRRAVQCRYQASRLRYDFPVLPLRKGWLHGHIR